MNIDIRSECEMLKFADELTCKDPDTFAEFPCNKCPYYKALMENSENNK